MNDPGTTSCNVNYQFRQCFDREFLIGTDVDDVIHHFLVPVGVQARFGIVIDEAERACLITFTIDRNILTCLRCAQEFRNNEIRALMRAIGVEEAKDCIIQSVFTVVGSEECFSDVLHDRIRQFRIERRCPCLLYTSDAADERSSVDLGGRRIIKKKKKTKQ